MPKTPLLFLAIALGVVCVSLQGIAEDAPKSRDDLPKIETSDAFNKLKDLLGDWDGKLERSTGEVLDLKLSYTLVSNDSVIIESALQDGEPMITTYTDRFGKLTATHYCALGNQPMFTLAALTGTAIDFDFDPVCGLKEGEHKFVKDWKINHDPKNADVLVTEYLLINEDKSLETSVAKLKRVTK
ncbi:MAG: hypothetical protein GY768_13885 [Planctomycetaceae bacterium]|nr:hypothetical protein [Planctomycetaceae bacterium]